MIPCKCNDKKHTIGLALWHRAYCNWFDSDRAGRTTRAKVWGWIADRVVRFA